MLKENQLAATAVTWLLGNRYCNCHSPGSRTQGHSSAAMFIMVADTPPLDMVGSQVIFGYIYACSTMSGVQLSRLSTVRAPVTCVVFKNK